MSPSGEQELVAFYVNLMVWIWTSVGKLLDEGIRKLTTAIFPRALPAAALVDARPEVVSGVANFSVVCLVLAGACAGFLAAVLLPAF